MKKDPNHAYLLLFGVFLLLQIPFIETVPRIMVDEPWYSNTAWNFTIGKGFTNTVPGAQGGDLLFLFSFLLGIAFKIFGTSLFVGKMISIFGGLIGLSGFLLVIKELRITNRFIVIVSGLLFTFSNVNYIVFRTVRPESWVVCFAIWSIFYLLKGNRSNHFNYYYLISGLLSGFSFLCHPHGAFFILLIGLLIIYRSYENNNFRIIILFITGSIIALLPLFYNIYIVREENLFQFIRILLGSSSNDYLDLIKNSYSTFSIFFENYTLGSKRLYIFLIEIGVLVLGLLYYKKDKRIFIFSLLGLLYFFLFILSPAYASRHFGQVLIFSYIVIALILNYYESNKQVFRVVTFLFLLYLTNNIAGDSYLIWRDYKNSSYNQLADSIDKIVPDETKVLTLFNFWFPLKNNENYNEYTRWRNTKYKNLKGLLDSGDIDYVVISDYMVEGVTPTSGRIERQHKINKNTIFYSLVYNYAKEKGKIIEIISTIGYGEIEIWDMNRP